MRTKIDRPATCDMGKHKSQRSCSSRPKLHSEGGGGSEDRAPAQDDDLRRARQCFRRGTLMGSRLRMQREERRARRRMCVNPQRAVELELRASEPLTMPASANRCAASALKSPERIATANSPLPSRSKAPNGPAYHFGLVSMTDSQSCARTLRIS